MTPQVAGQWVVAYRYEGASPGDHSVYAAAYTNEGVRRAVKACTDRHPEAYIWAAPDFKVPFPSRRRPRY